MRFALPLVLAAAAGCAWHRTTGDHEIKVEDERSIEVVSERAIVRLLNRGTAPIEVTAEGKKVVLETSEDKEYVLYGSTVITLRRRGGGEGFVEMHYQTEGRRSFVHLK